LDRTPVAGCTTTSCGPAAVGELARERHHLRDGLAVDLLAGADARRLALHGRHD
jgi:hypothetical protein